MSAVLGVSGSILEGTSVKATLYYAAPGSTLYSAVPGATVTLQPDFGLISLLQTSQGSVSELHYPVEVGGSLLVWFEAENSEFFGKLTGSASATVSY